MVAVGVDGYRRGWVAVALLDGRFDSAFAAPLLTDVLARYAGAGAFGVDIPIGLAVAGVRTCDVEARKLVGPRASSVFLTPPRAAVEAVTYAAARAAAPGVTAQAWNLARKILEVDAVVDPRVCEVHPEVSFWRMAGRHLRQPKKTWAGMHDRLDILNAQDILLPDSDLGPAGSVPPDDLIDAAAAAWTAGRIAAGTAESVGDALARIWF